MSAHYPKLREYFMDVTRELIVKGVIKAKMGKPIPDVLGSEIITVLKYVQDDMTTLAAELGFSVVKFGTNWLRGLVEGMVGSTKGRKR